MSVNHKALRRWTEFILHGGWAGGREFSGSARRPRGMLVALGDHSRIYKEEETKPECACEYATKQ